MFPLGPASPIMLVLFETMTSPSEVPTRVTSTCRSADNAMGSWASSSGLRLGGGAVRVNMDAPVLAMNEPRKKKQHRKADFARIDHKALGDKAEDYRIPVPPVKFPPVGYVRSLVLKQLICGIVAGGISAAATGPFGFVKTKVIAHSGGETAEQVVGNIARTQGLSKLRPGGWLKTVFFTSLSRGAQFVVYEAVKRREERRLGKDLRIFPIPRAVQVSTLAGALAGLASLLVTYPINTISDRLILQPNEYGTLLDSIKKVFRREGLGALFTGALPAAYKIVPSAAAEFYAYEALKNRFVDKKKNIGVETLFCGAAAGAFSSLLTYPLELARKEISLSRVPTTEFAYSSTWDALSGILAKEGYAGLYRGVKVELLQIVPQTAVSFLVYELMKRALIAVDEEKRGERKG